MTTWMRGMLWIVWLAVTGWLWHGGALGTVAALASAAVGLVVVALPAAAGRRRRSGLRYVEMGKQPVGLL
jgi:hypothetical protein